MSACSALTGGLTAPCKPSASGVRPKLVLVNFDDIASSSRSATPGRKKFVTFTLKNGKIGYLFEGKEGTDSSNAVRTKFLPGKFGGGYGHEVDLVAFAGGPTETAVMLERMEELGLGAKSVGVIPDNNGGYRVLGLNAGLGLNKDEYNSDDADTNGGHQVTLASTKEIGHADLLGVFTSGGTPVYDPTATAAAFEALYTPQA